ncbi:MAG: hypothetical protein K9M99_00740 [Candidatus Cloacimonetes bacterium]|nr:hypothetical protein [Candidatus Cloacimonadota bacterium]
MKYIIMIIITLSLITACDLTSPERYVKDKLVIAGYLIAGKTVSVDNPIFIGKTISTEGGNILDVIIPDATVTIENMNEELIFQLYFNDSFPNFGYYNNALIIKAGNTYEIQVEAVIDSVTVQAYAQTTVPDSIYLDLDYRGLATPEYGFADEYSDNLPAIPFTEMEDNFPIYSRYTDGSVVYSYYNFYCLEEFSTELEFTQPIFGYEHLEEDDADSYNSPLSNNMRESSMIWRYQPLQDEDGYWYLLEETYDGGFQYYGRYRITIYSADTNFYTYQYHSESYLYGGIVGGIGYFGSVSGEDYYTTVIK